jgi:hypothetical protein
MLFRELLALPTHRIVLAIPAAPAPAIRDREAIVERLVQHLTALVALLEDKDASAPDVFQLAGIQSHVLARFRFLAFRYSSIARRMSSLTGAPVSCERFLRLADWSSRTCSLMEIMCIIIPIDTCRCQVKSLERRASLTVFSPSTMYDPRQIWGLLCYGSLGDYGRKMAILRSQV